MRERGGDFVSVAEYGPKDDRHVLHVAYDAKDRTHAFAAFRCRPFRTGRRWVGDVFFDHVRGVVDEDPEPADCKAPHPFVLVCYQAYFDWNATGSAMVEEYDSAAELIAKAKEYVANERAAGTGVSELWEVYGVRVLKYRG